MHILSGALSDVAYLTQLTRIRKVLAVPNTQSAQYEPGTRPSEIVRTKRYVPGKEFVAVRCAPKPSKHPRGADALHAKLTEAQISTIRAELAKGGRGTNIKLALEYGVSAAAISDIKHGRSWSHVSDS